MSFGFGSGGFGGSASPFGASSQPAMGQSAGGFGASPSPFGGGQSSVFGQQSQPAFGAGASATPAFGGGGFGATTGTGFGASSSTPSFGGGGFNAPKPSGFGFGQSSAGGFGAPASASGFGSSGSAFGGGGQSPFGGGSSFGQPQQATGTSFGSGGFGQPQQSFGATGGGFGTQTPGAFGGFGGQSGFGAQGIQSRGTRSVAWKKTQEIDQSSTGARSTVQYNSISVMPEYASKSVEELRWEDYQDGNKGGTQQGPPGGAFGQQQPTPGGSSPFGQQPAQGGSPFGQSLQSTGFGGGTTTSSFGGFGSTAPASSSAFGAPTSSSSFGGFGGSPASKTPSFGGFGASSTPAFGAAPTPGFGSTLGSSSAFGASSAGGFGASSTPAFGSPAPAPSFGGFGASSAPAFGAASTPAFGSSSPFSTPSFGAPQSTPSLFGSTPASTPSFGAASQSSFSLFGGSTPKPSTGFSFAAASTPSFGFGQTQAGGMFGSSPSPGFGTGGSGLFAASTPAVQPSPFTLNPVSSPAASTPFGSAQVVNGTSALQAGLQSGSPYGNMPEAPKLTPLPEYKVGLTQRILAPPSAGPPKAVTLITPRSLTPHGGKLRPRRGTSASRLSKSPAEFFASSSLQASTPGSVTSASVISEGNIFVPRDNPRRLLIRDELPSTSSASKLSLAGLSAEKTSPDRTPRLEINGRTSSPASLAFRTISPAQFGENKNDLADIGSCMPHLTMEDYYFEPSATQLAAIAREDPDELSKICNFIVGRKDVGFIRWMEPVDIRGINLDEIVSLATGSVEVYPESSNKPPVGEGLNKPAMITLLKIFKIDEATKKPTKDPEKVEKFVRKIKKKSGEQGAEFISYNVETGIWKFSVEHFSKYGLLDSSDDEETLEDNLNQHKEDQKADAEAGIHVLPLDSSESEDEILGLRGRSAVKKSVDRYVEMSEEPPAPSEYMVNREETSLGYEEAPYDVRNDHFGQPLSILDGYKQLDDIMEGVSMQEEQFPRISYWEASQGRKGIRPPMGHTVLEDEPEMNTLGSSKALTSSRVLPDIGSFLHDSIRVTWGPQDSLLIPQVTEQGGYRVDYCKIRPTNIRPDVSKKDHDREFLISQLRLHFDYSFPNENRSSMDLNPKWRLHCSRSSNKLRELTIKYIKTCHNYLKEATSHQSEKKHGSVKVEAEAWDLVSALFTNVPAEEATDSIEEDILADSMARMASMQRRASLSRWLKDRTFSAVKRKLEELPRDNKYDMKRILVCLSGHELSSAALCASSIGNVRLATLISAAGYAPLGMEHVQKQKDVWNKAGYDPFIDEQLMEVYNLLSGNVDAVVGAADDDWKRAFGLYLWYGTPKDSPIHTALESFVSSANKGQAPQPVPWHVKESPASDNISDVCFELIRIFCCTEDWDLLSEKMEATLPILPDLLCPLGTTPDVLDCSFLWHLFSVLQSIDVFPQSLAGEYSDAIQKITSSYIAQIESMENLVHWAVYVALHIADDDLRAKTVKDLLTRYCDEWREDNDLVGFLLGDLGIPQVWLEEAKIIWAESHGDNEMLLEALIDSQQWQKAHDLLLSSIGPQWLLSKPTQGQAGMLEILLKALEELENHHNEILAESWRIGGQLYLLYLRIKLGLIANGPESAELLQEIATSLDRGFMSLKGKISEQATFQRAAYTSIARDILDWSKTLGLNVSGKRALRYSAVSSYIQTAAASLGPCM